MEEMSSAVALRRLRATDLFGGLEDSDLERFAGGVSEAELAPGEVLIRQGEAPDRLFVVLRGRLLVLLAADGQPDQTLAEIGPGGVVGEIALIAGGPRSATVRALEKTDLLGVSSDALRRLLDTRPEALAGLLEVIRQRLNSIQLAIHLGQLIGPVEPAVLREFEAEVQWVRLPSGEVLFEQGESGDCAFIVTSGRLRVVLERDGAEEVVSEVGRGELIGEMALLDGSARSATVYAIRDSHLAKFSEAVFSRLTGSYPRAAQRVAAFVVARLRRRLAGRGIRDSAITTIAALPASPGVEIAEVTRLLAASLGTHGATRRLTIAEVDAVLGRRGISGVPADDPASIRLEQWLAEQEATHRYVVYEADPAHAGWTDRTIRQADHVLIVADADADPEPGATEARMAGRWASRAPSQSLVLLHADDAGEPSGTSRWLQARSVDGHYHVRRKAASDFARLARSLTGRAVGLVLGGGGARGFAHLGVLRAMEEVGVPLDLVGGTSIGAIIAGGCAMRLRSDELLARCRQHFAAVFDPTLPLLSLLAGRRIGAELAAGFGDRSIEDLPIPFFCVSTNLTTAAETLHRSGPLADAIRASLSLPGILPPVTREGHLLVDGALLNNLPTDVMERFSLGGLVIGVDVAPELDLEGSYDFKSELSGWKVLWDRINPFRRAPGVPNILSVLVRSTLVASAAASRRKPVDEERNLSLEIPVGDWKLLEFRAIEAIAEQGYAASIDPIRDWWARVGP